MELKEIQNLIRFVAKSGASEVKLEMGDIKITIRTGSDKQETTIIQQPGPVPVQVPAAAETAAPKEVAQTPPATDESKEDASKYIEIKSPINARVCLIIVGLGERMIISLSQSLARVCVAGKRVEPRSIMVH